MSEQNPPYHGPFSEQVMWMRSLIEQSSSPIELHLMKCNIARFVLSHYDQAALDTIVHSQFPGTD